MSAKSITKTIEVVLKQKVPGLGEKGEVVKVKFGYFLNFLLPQGLASKLDKKTKQDLANKKAVQKAKKKEKLLELKKLQQKFPLELAFRRRLNEKKKLYQPVKDEDIIKRLEAEGLVKQISLPKIDKKGEFEGQVLFFDGKKGKIVVKVDSLDS